MKRVLLTSGPRGAGKSGYVKLLAAHHPEVAIVERDEVLLSLFGTTALSPYEGGHQYALEVVFEKLRKLLSHECHIETIIFDCWNSSEGERRGILHQLREFGADEVICLYFIIPVETCIEWFFKKPDSKGYSVDGIARDHALFYKRSSDIHKEEFDNVIEVYPAQLRFSHFPFL